MYVTHYENRKMHTIDNLNYLLGDDLKISVEPGSRVSISASKFSIFAFESLKDNLNNISAFRFVFSSPTFTSDSVLDNSKRHAREFYIPKKWREETVFGSEFEIALRNKLSQKAIAIECAQWIREKASFKTNKTNSQMQQYAFIDKSESFNLYLPFNGFTAADLGYQKSDSFSNIITRIDDRVVANAFVETFEQLWKDDTRLEDVTEKIIEHVSTIYNENSPESVYFQILNNVFEDFLEDIDEDFLPNDKVGYKESLIWKKLFNYQRDAAIGIINKLETYNGCILADSVGLGKTFTALAVVKYYELRNKSVLVLCPKKLADNWLNYNRNLKTNIFAQDRFNYDVLNHTDLSRNSGESYGMPLNRINWGNYDLVVIDESHNFRNNDALKERETRYQKLMNKVIKEGVKTKVLMLSATPVNNHFGDLKNQLALAYEGDSGQLSEKLKTNKSIEVIFRRAQAAFNAWSKLPPEKRTPKAILDSLDFDFFELLDSVTIARSRKHIESFYDTSEIGKFPKRNKPISHRKGLTSRLDVPSFNQIYEQLTLVKMATYAPISYILPSRIEKYEDLYDTEVEGGRSKLRQADREKSLQMLMTTLLLKRLESSIEAFRLTLKSLLSNIENNLETIAAFQANGQSLKIADIPDDLEELEAEDDDFQGFSEFAVGGKTQIELEDMDIPSWKSELEGDSHLLKDLLGKVDRVTPPDDLKLRHLKEIVREKILNPINTHNKKIIIFTAFADTAKYIYKNLAPDLKEEFGINSALVTGSENPKSTLKTSYDFQSILTLFSPVSKSKELVLPHENEVIDILIATDCISEGQNLQDCDYLINYDIHWNPVRIIQRFGRIDRIGSKNDVIQLVNYWPDISLDEYINLKERVENRMIIADVTATGDDNVLTAKSSDIAYRKEQLRRLQDEVIELEDVKTGVSITDLGLNDFRMDLLNYSKDHPNFKMPKGVHAVVPEDFNIGLFGGAIFIMKNVHNEINQSGQNRLHPYYMVYMDDSGNTINNHTDVKRLLDLIRAACRGKEEPIKAAYSKFNKLTQDGRKMEKYSNLLSEAIKSIINTKEEKDIDSLFSNANHSVFEGKIKGLDDFELIAFVVVQA